MPYVSSYPDVVEALAQDDVELPDLYLLEGEGARHTTPRGNAAVLPALLRGLEGRYDAP